MEFQHPPILEAVVLGLHVQQRNQQVIEYVQLQYCTAPSVGLKKNARSVDKYFYNSNEEG